MSSIVPNSVSIPIRINTDRPLKDTELQGLHEQLEDILSDFCNSVKDNGMKNINIEWSYFDMRKTFDFS